MKNSNLKLAQVKPSPLAEIKQLHSEILNAAHTTLDKAIRIGELLTKEKSRLAHGQWLPWLETNVQFTDRTARNYIRLFDERDQLKSESVSDLTSAYRLLAPPREWEELTPVETANPPKLAVPEKQLDEAALAVRSALIEIRDAKLYRENHDTFADFCHEQWGWSADETHVDIKIADSFLLRIELADSIQ